MHGRKEREGRKGKEGEKGKGKSAAAIVTTFCCGSHAVSSEAGSNLMKCGGLGVVLREREGRARHTCLCLWSQLQFTGDSGSGGHSSA